MKLNNLKYDRGVAGTTVLLSLIVSLFVIGLLVMIFALMGGSLQTASYTATTVAVTNESGAWINETTYTVDQSTASGFRTLTLTSLINATSGAAIGTGNVTVSGSGFTNATTTNWDNVNVSYTYVYSANNTATDVIGDTTSSIATVTTFFSLFIVIGAMVVLILLTVIIIVAIRQSGMMSQGVTA